MLKFIQSVIYFEKGNGETKLYTSANEMKVIKLPFEKMLEKCCEEDLCTLEGRIKATKYQYHMNKFIPIYLSDKVILFPTGNKRDVNTIYVNAIMVGAMKELDENHTLLYFQNGTSIVIEKRISLLNHYYERCLKIRKIDQK